jgi:hypothetical protein
LPPPSWSRPAFKPAAAACTWIWCTHTHTPSIFGGKWDGPRQLADITTGSFYHILRVLVVSVDLSVCVIVRNAETRPAPLLSQNVVHQAWVCAVLVQRNRLRQK